MNPPPKISTLWIFPEEDFEAWQDLYDGETPEKTYLDYINTIELLESSIQLVGSKSVRVFMTVYEMQKRIIKFNLENTVGNRAVMIGEKYEELIGQKEPMDFD